MNDDASNIAEGNALRFQQRPPEQRVARHRPRATAAKPRDRAGRFGARAPWALLCLSLCASALSAGAAEFNRTAEAGPVKIADDSMTLRVDYDGAPALRYALKKPAESACASPSAGYFHPLTTPSGLTVTDLAPDDHLHHRGVFLAWLEVRGQAGEGDFWGWGQHAPVADRRVAWRATDSVGATTETASFTVRNEWLAGSTPLVEETLRAKVTFLKDARVHDLAYLLTPKGDIALNQHAFSGFAVRLRKDFPLTACDPSGKVSLPAPSHLKPESDWPARPWYAFEMALANGKKAGVAVLSHPQNPPTFWHNVTSIALLNPCIIAPAAVCIPSGQPLPLRYQVVTFDGPVPTALLNDLSAEFAKTPIKGD